MELTDHQTHLKSVTEQAQGLIKEIQDLETQAKNKRDMLLKLQGIIEYLQQTGVELPKEVPAPPEPPLGVPWFQDVLDYTEVGEFQTAGLAVLILVVLNALFIPVTIKRGARLKRILAARKRNQATRNMADDFEDFFE